MAGVRYGANSRPGVTLIITPGRMPAGNGASSRRFRHGDLVDQEARTLLARSLSLGNASALRCNPGSERPSRLCSVIGLTT